MSRGIIKDPAVTQTGGVPIATPSNLVMVSVVLDPIVNTQSGTISVQPPIVPTD